MDLLKNKVLHKNPCFWIFMSDFKIWKYWTPIQACSGPENWLSPEDGLVFLISLPLPFLFLPVAFRALLCFSVLSLMNVLVLLSVKNTYLRGTWVA